MFYRRARDDANPDIARRRHEAEDGTGVRARGRGRSNSRHRGRWGSDHIREASRHPRAYCVTGEGQPGGGMGGTKRCKNADAWEGLSRAEGALTPQNPKPCLCRRQTAGPVASARNFGAGVVSGTPIKHPVSQWGASTCFAAKMIPGFPENLAFDDLAFDNFTIIVTGTSVP